MGRNSYLQIEGQRFGRLTVMYRVEDKIDPKSGKHKTVWHCKCDCGNEKDIIGASLTSGATQSCGCLHKENSSITARTKISHGKKYNKFDLSGEYGIGYTTKGEEFYFDKEDYEKIKDTCWFIHSRGYVLGHNVGSTKRYIQMHRLVMGLSEEDKRVIDHINTHRKNDNRKSNLRITTQANNTKNRMMPRNNTSGIKGVSYNKKNKKWYAYIGINGKIKSLGYFKELEVAKQARITAEKIFFGEYRYKGEEI